MNHTTPMNKRSGFTLVEVAVALAIFVIGALAIVRIFPGALEVVQDSGDQMVATNLNRGSLEKYLANGAQIPFATRDVDNGPAVPPAAVIGSARRNASLPASAVADVSQTALGRFRMIVGERHRVPEAGPTYVLTRYPYAENPATYPALTDTADVYAYSEENVEGVTVEDDGELDFSNAMTAIGNIGDPTNPKVPLTNYRMLPASNSKDKMAVGDTIFYVTYEWNNGTDIQRVIDEPIAYPPGAVTTPPQLAQAIAFPTKVIPGPVKVRMRRLEYKIDTAAPITQKRLLGYVEFPTAAAGKEFTLDYIVDGWSWLAWDSTPSIYPDPGFIEKPRITAPLAADFRGVELPYRRADDDRDVNIYALLVDRTATPTLYFGEWSAANDPPTSTPGAGTSGHFVYSRKKNQVFFDGADTMTAPEARICYKSEDGWAHQLSVAAKSYFPILTSAPSATTEWRDEPWRSYAWSKTSSPGRIYLPPSEAGKVILVSYIDATGKRVDDAVVTVSERWVQAADVPAHATRLMDLTGNSQFLAEALPSLDPNTGDPIDLDSVLGVRGASIQIRTAWVNGERYSQATVAGYRND